MPTMGEDFTKKPGLAKRYTGSGVGIGAALGVLLGISFGRFALGLAFGTAFGAALDVVSYVRRKNPEKPR